MQKIYRIENEETMHGMWYEEDGTFNPFIYRLTEGKSKDLPMGFHERYSKGGLKWFSGCKSIEDMKHWFSDLDALELFKSGYKLFEMDLSQYIVEENQVIFTREGVLDKREIQLDTIWNVDKLDTGIISL